MNSGLRRSQTLGIRAESSRLIRPRAVDDLLTGYRHFGMLDHSAGLIICAAAILQPPGIARWLRNERGQLGTAALNVSLFLPTMRTSFPYSPASLIAITRPT